MSYHSINEYFINQGITDIENASTAYFLADFYLNDFGKEKYLAFISNCYLKKYQLVPEYAYGMALVFTHIANGHIHLAETALYKMIHSSEVRKEIIKLMEEDIYSKLIICPFDISFLNNQIIK